MYFKPLILAGALALATTAEARDVTDMLGRTVTVPDEIESNVTIGAVPVLNTYVFAAGQGPKLGMALPANWDHVLGRYQFVFAPQLTEMPLLQDANYAPDLEKVLAAAPDVALSFDAAAGDLLEANGIPTVMMRVSTPDEIKAGVGLVGEVFGDSELGERYSAYFDANVARVAERLADIPQEERPSILYLNPKIMTQPHLIAEWWIPAGGGVSVTAGERSGNALPLTVEAVIAANPDYIFVQDLTQLPVLQEHPALSDLDAVRNGRAFASPRGAHVWGNRAVELALTPLWLAGVLYPERFPRDELIAQTQGFYADFFKTEASAEQVENILAGSPGDK
ncbi:MAG: ABC transporter substrate-binding protein [Tropicimonas sp.]|uniref:ABC transporter substrate-binding protein n=1 Tax=Tropicimonas sp. TaxID=2067044 RepID=UPI003A858F71